ncbi:hypothetical protein RKD19_001059 [Streptomyces canus]|uniref:hypothetical protein n=1 Tax=unclassified Streptomyces TaxID=2593676 RepID=UPI0021ADB047|nr:hypothetical protein [Streptomyces sp. RP5T]
MTRSPTFRHITPGATVPPPRPHTTAAASLAAGTATRAGTPLSAVDHVADFYGAYTDALTDRGRGQLVDALRRHYLTPELRRSLARWEATHHRDGVLRAAGVPAAWQVDHHDSGTGHCWSRVTLTWEDAGDQPHQTHLVVQSDLGTRRISGIRADR